MGLGGAYAIAAIAHGHVILPGEYIVPIDIARRRNRDRAALPFEIGVAHGRAVRIGIAEAMPVNPTVHRAFMGQHKDGLVFSGDVRIPAAALRHHRFDLAKQKARGVDVMNQSLIDQEPAELPEVRLLRIWLVFYPLSPSRAQPLSTETPRLSPTATLLPPPLP